MGEYFADIPANLLTKERPSSSSPQPEIVKLKGKRFVMGSEPEANQKINTGFMKYITGGDPMSGRLCHSNDIVHFLPHFKLALLCNYIPIFDCDDKGTYRRSRIIDFPVTFKVNPKKGNIYQKQIDETMKSRVKDCKLEFMIYLMTYFKKSKNMQRLKPTEKVIRMVEEHKKKGNMAIQFIETQTEESEECHMHMNELYEKFKDWMVRENPGVLKMTKNLFIENLKKISEINVNKCRIKDTIRLGVKYRKMIERNEDEFIDESEPAYEDGTQMTF